MLLLSSFHRWGKWRTWRSGNLPKDAVSGDLNPATLAAEPSALCTASFSWKSSLWRRQKHWKEPKSELGHAETPTLRKFNYLPCLIGHREGETQLSPWCPCYHCLQGWINAETEIGVAVASSTAAALDKGRGQGVVSAFQLWGPGNGAESQCRRNNELTTSLCQGSAAEESSVGCEERSSDASTPSLSLWRRLKVLARPSSELPASVIQHLTADTGFNERISSSCSNRGVRPTSGLTNQVTPSSSIPVIMVPPGRGTKQNCIFSDLKSLWEMCWNPHSLTSLPSDPGQIVCSQLQFPYL